MSGVLNLESDSTRDLDFASGHRRTLESPVGACRRHNRGGDGSELAARNVVDGVRKVRVVQHVEEVCADRKPQALG